MKHFKTLRYNDVIRGQQGFICPTCMVALSSPEQLQSHWESVHNTDFGGGAVAMEEELVASPAATTNAARQNSVQANVSSRADARVKINLSCISSSIFFNSQF